MLADQQHLSLVIDPEVGARPTQLPRLHAGPRSAFRGGPPWKVRNLGASPADGYGMTAISAATSRPLDLTAAIPSPPQPNVAPFGPDYDALFQTSDARPT